jgi:hypothetical protein
MRFAEARWHLVVFACLACLGGSAAAQPGTQGPRTTAPPTPSLDDLLPYKPSEVMLRTLRAIEAQRDRAAIPALIELLRFDLPIPAEPVVRALEGPSGERLGKDWGRWVEWLQKRSDIVPAPGFAGWKGRLFSIIDPEFAEWFKIGVPHRIRLEEIVWGGVQKDGIPALTNPGHLPAADVTWLTDAVPTSSCTTTGRTVSGIT